VEPCVHTSTGGDQASGDCNDECAFEDKLMFELVSNCPLLFFLRLLSKVVLDHSLLEIPLLWVEQPFSMATLRGCCCWDMSQSNDRLTSIMRRTK